MPQTGIALVDWFLGVMQTWGYLVVFVITIFENLFVIGSFTPGETFVLTAAFVASRGSLSLPVVWTLSVVGTTIGSNIGYVAGWRLGRDTVQRQISRLAATRIGSRLGLSDDSLADAELYFYRHGSKTVLLSRFAVGLKNIVPVVAGVSRMGPFFFELYTVLGAVVYTSLMCAIGWFLGENLDLALRIASGIGYFGLLIVLALFAAVWWAGRRVRLRRQETEIAEEAAEEAGESVAEAIEEVLAEDEARDE